MVRSKYDPIFIAITTIMPPVILAPITAAAAATAAITENPYPAQKAAGLPAAFFLLSGLFMEI